MWSHAAVTGKCGCRVISPTWRESEAQRVEVDRMALAGSSLPRSDVDRSIETAYRNGNVFERSRRTRKHVSTMPHPNPPQLPMPSATPSPRRHLTARLSYLASCSVAIACTSSGGTPPAPGATSDSTSSTPATEPTTQSPSSPPTTTGNGTNPAPSTPSTETNPPGSSLPTPTPSSAGGQQSTSQEQPGSETPAPTVPGALGGFVCPSFEAPSNPVEDGATAVRIEGVPPADDFATSSDTIVLEGPVWWNGSLYLSQINTGTPTFGRPGGFPGADADAGSLSSESDAGPEMPPRPPPSRLLRVNSDGSVEVVIADAGTNGLAVDGSGRLLAGEHRTGAIVAVDIVAQTGMGLVTQFDGVRFNSPNDLTVGQEGTIYFTDPDYQAPVPAPQAATRAYRIPPGSTSAVPFAEDRRQPNGITLSPDRTTLYMSASDGLVAYPVLPDGALGTGEPFATGVVRSSDGMAVDCAGNLYTTSGQTVVIVDASGAEVGRIAVPDVQSVTNVAFGGADNKTIYITTLGSGSRVGLFTHAGQVPGMPY